MQPDPFATWGLDGAPKLFREAANAVFVGTRNGATVYVRLTSLEHRTADELVAEVTWMQTLAQAGLRVVRPLASRAGSLVEPTSWRGAPALAIATEGAPGRPARKPDDFVPPVIESWAELLAGLHAHAPAAPEGRSDWDADRVFVVAQAATAADVRPAQRALAELVAWMRTLPRDRGRYGLTHADLHLGNLAVDDTAPRTFVTAFDFDDACVHWFAHDLAVAVTSIRKAAWETPGRFDARDAEDRFLTCYATAATNAGLAPVPPDTLERFVRYRIALTACWASRALELGILDEDMRAWYVRSRPWWLAELEGQRAAGSRGALASVSRRPDGTSF